jgi:hypothetical protein
MDKVRASPAVEAFWSYAFMPFGMTYTLRRTGPNWRIVLAMIHSADAR